MDYNYLKTLPKDILIKLIVELETSFRTVYILNRSSDYYNDEAGEIQGVYTSFEKAIESIEAVVLDVYIYSSQRKELDDLSAELTELCSQNKFDSGVYAFGYRYSISKRTIE